MKLAPFACVLTTDLTTGATICHVRERQQNNELTALANNGVLTRVLTVHAAEAAHRRAMPPFALTTGATICHVRERPQNELTALANNGVLTLNKRYYFYFLPTESHRAPYRGDVRRTEGPTSHLTLAMRILYDA